MDNSNVIYWTPGMNLEAIEKIVILKAFQHFRGNKTTTANCLGIAVRTLDAKLEKYRNDGIEQDKREAEYRAKQREFELRQRGQSSFSINASDEERQAQLESVGRAAPGIPVESTSQVPTEQPVPVQERKEVQKVLPQNNAPGRDRRSG